MKSARVIGLERLLRSQGYDPEVRSRLFLQARAADEYFKETYHMGVRHWKIEAAKPSPVLPGDEERDKDHLRFWISGELYFSYNCGKYMSDGSLRPTPEEKEKFQYLIVIPYDDLEKKEEK